MDGEVLDWFKKDGKGYQSRINTVLRSYMENMEPRKVEVGPLNQRPHFTRSPL